MQGATDTVGVNYFPVHVSIHAPYAGSDGESSDSEVTAAMFQSTPPMQGATVFEMGEMDD